MYASKSTYAIFIAMVVFSAAILWIYYSTPVVTNIPPFQKNKPIQPVGESNVVKVFYVALDDNGYAGKPIGCGDSIVGVEKEIPATTTPLSAAMNLLLSDKKETSTSSRNLTLSNTLRSSSLKVAAIKVATGTAELRLTGTISLAGECDAPRVEAQLEETALQFPAVDSVKIFINNKPLSEVLSLQ